ncbi:TetR/AcrR family transcriptional regulator [Pseudovibrio sp. SPO723]|nr:TetR/AcrR family transcriptional regulator [Pseudovibrio sp. SPO723]
MNKSQLEILEAAADCFANYGADAVSIDDIARHLHATKGRIYHHFRSKSELLCAVRMRSVSLMFDQIAPIVDSIDDPLEAMKKMAFTHVQLILGHHSFHRVVSEDFRVFFNRSTTPDERRQIQEIIDKRTAYENLFREVLRKGMKSGVFAERPISLTVHSLITLLNSPSIWYSPRPNQTQDDRDVIARDLAQMALGALGVKDA